MAQRRKILAVDDGELNLEIMEEILAEDYDLRTASNGEQALELMAIERPEIVLLDIMMPGIDGYETCRRIKTDPVLRHAMVILVSAKAMTAERLRGYEAGADDYITKPFDRDELLAKVRIFLRLKSAEEIDEIKSDLLTLVTHELRTPLTGILPAGEMLSRDGDMPLDERHMWGDIILQNGRRLLALAERGILLCRFRAGQVGLDVQEFDVCDLARTAVEEYVTAAADDGIALTADLGEPLPIEGDRELVQTALRCLVEGMVRLTPADGTVRLELEPTGEGVELRVSATRVELDPECVDALFEAFGARRVGGEPVGSELAFALALAVARAHGGDLEAHCEADGFVVFAATLPASCGVTL